MNSLSSPKRPLDFLVGTSAPTVYPARDTALPPLHLNFSSDPLRAWFLLHPHEARPGVNFLFLDAPGLSVIPGVTVPHYIPFIL